MCRARGAAYQKFAGLYLLATIWMTNRVGHPGVEKTEVTPLWKWLARYWRVEDSRAALEQKHTIITNRLVVAYPTKDTHLKGSASGSTSTSCGSEASC